MRPVSAVETVTFFGKPMTRIGIMDINTAYTMEHYGKPGDLYAAQRNRAAFERSAEVAASRRS